MLWRVERRIGLERSQRDRLRPLEQLRVLRQPSNPELLVAVLARAEHLAALADREVDLGEAKAVALLGQRSQARLFGIPEEHAQPGMPAAPDSPAQLVQLR